ncbi:MAG: hypothetical protein NC187_00210 [Candidatus Amulumruptor caecigallinarius]|nr:hypothetical protein [Candidatus Amulumruptor caecigallinarius]MCM1395898.1 hypothetical protein [Candidatus Amulumruptor caecigallinarius]MCM1452933.1 hypothetical protein [bacterium]
MAADLYTPARHGLLKATLWLYLRMGVLTLVQLAVTSLLLDAMGVDDYGLWTIACSLVMLWSFPSDVAGEVTLRWLSVSRGRGETQARQLSIFYALRRRARLIVGFSAVISVGAGVWWMTCLASVPDEMITTGCILVAVLTLVMALKSLSTQYVSWLVAAERWRAYAWLSIAEGVATLVCAAAVCTLSQADVTYVYVWSLVAVEGVILLCYRRVSGASRDGKAADVKQTDGAGRYMLWNVVGGLGVIIWLQGMTPVMNASHGLGVTAAVAIAMMLLGRIRAFCAGFQRAVVPRLMRLYAAGARRDVRKLLSRYSALCFAMAALLLALLVWMAPWWLGLWLDDVPEGCVTMVRVALAAALLCCIDVPLDAVVMARGSIRAYELAMGSLLAAAPLAVIIASLCGATAEDAFVWQLLPLTVALPLRILFALRATR